MGCKYILLLEILSDDYHQFERRDDILSSCLSEKDLQQTKQDIAKADRYRQVTIDKILELIGKCEINPFIKDQPSLLLAPEINNTFEILNLTISPFKHLDFPNREQIQCLISNSNKIFNLMGLISFAQDTIARDDVDFLNHQLQNRTLKAFLHQEFSGTHNTLLEPNVENLVCCIDLILQELKQRQRK